MALNIKSGCEGVFREASRVCWYEAPLSEQNEYYGSYTSYTKDWGCSTARDSFRYHACNYRVWILVPETQKEKRTIELEGVYPESKKVYQMEGEILCEKRHKLEINRGKIKILEKKLE